MVEFCFNLDVMQLSNSIVTDLPLEIFGIWQVEDYVPPTAENGVVPRNAYGNVELFKDCMLPKGTVHLRRKIMCVTQKFKNFKYFFHFSTKFEQGGPKIKYRLCSSGGRFRFSLGVESSNV